MEMVLFQWLSPSHSQEWSYTEPVFSNIEPRSMKWLQFLQKHKTTQLIANELESVVCGELGSRRMFPEKVALFSVCSTLLSTGPLKIYLLLSHQPFASKDRQFPTGVQILPSEIFK